MARLNQQLENTSSSASDSNTVNLEDKMLTETHKLCSDVNILSEENSVRMIIEQEQKYKRELWRLQKIIRRSMKSEDPLPLFNRRHLFLLVKRLCKDLEKSTNQLKPGMDISKVVQVLQSSTSDCHGLLCIAYADTLDEMREFLKREMKRRNDASICFCREMHAERSLLPLHRLKYLKSLSCLKRQHSDIISSALDGCFIAISSLHSQKYTLEIDSLLDFALNMDPPPLLYYCSSKMNHFYSDSTASEKTDSPDEHVYEEIEIPDSKQKRRSFLIRMVSKKYRNEQANEEFIPLTRINHNLGDSLC